MNKIGKFGPALSFPVNFFYEQRINGTNCIAHAFYWRLCYKMTKNSYYWASKVLFTRWNEVVNTLQTWHLKNAFRSCQIFGDLFLLIFGGHLRNHQMRRKNINWTFSAQSSSSFILLKGIILSGIREVGSFIQVALSNW